MSQTPSRRITDRPGGAGLSSFGLGPRDGAAQPAPVLDQAARRSEGQFALSVLAGTLGGVYFVAGATLLGRDPALAAVLVGAALLQAAWVAMARQSSRPALIVGFALNAVLFVAWLLSHTSGLPLEDGSRPVGVLDALCALDSAVIVVLVGYAAERGLDAARWTGALSHLAILLAVLTAAALLGGHTHTAQAATGHASLHFYCRLL